MINRFSIRLGIPDFENLWIILAGKYNSRRLSKNERILFNKLGKTLILLSQDPYYSGLHSHKINLLSEKLGIPVFQSYIESKVSGAGRNFWAYGPGSMEITVLGFAPHTDDKNASYDKIKLSGFPI
jgi:hypothetical protein